MRKILWIITITVWISCGWMTGIAEPTTTKTSRLWNLQDADIISIINEVSLETGKNFVIDPRVSGKISLVSSKPLQPDEVYDVFLSILGMLGYSAIPTGDIVKIVPNMEGGEYATQIATSHKPGKGDEVVVRVIALEHGSAGQLVPIIRPLLPQWSNVSVYTPGNILIVLGRANNIDRITHLVEQIDKTSDNNIEVVPLHQASAAQMAIVLSNLQNAGRSTGEVPQISIAPDERSNSILLGGNKSARLHIRYLISQLDAPSTAAQGNTEVIYLRYLQAKDFAPVLGKIAQNITGSKDSTEKNMPNVPLAAMYGSNTQRDKATVDNSTNIQAEPNTNALIITAPPTLMKALKIVVTKLDIRPAQVLIEGIIVELDDSDLQNLGIQWGTLTDSSTPQSNGAVTDFSPLGAGTFGIIPHAQIRAVLSLLENKTGVNILSTPSVVVLDNQKATLEVGKEVPRETGSYATSNSTSTVAPFNTFDYRKVALILNVTPQINLGDAVRMKLMLTNDTLQNPDDPGLTPLINTSKIENSVIVNTDDVLVLGGLISNNIHENINRIPFFSDIPILGNLFQQKTRKLEKKNLMVFLKPIIMHNSNDAMALTNSKYAFIREQQIRWPTDLSREGDQKLQNILPLWKNNIVLPKPFEDG